MNENLLQKIVVSAALLNGRYEYREMNSLLTRIQNGIEVNNNVLLLKGIVNNFQIASVFELDVKNNLSTMIDELNKSLNISDKKPSKKDLNNVQSSVNKKNAKTEEAAIDSKLQNDPIATGSDTKTDDVDATIALDNSTVNTEEIITEDAEEIITEDVEEVKPAVVEPADEK